MTELMHPTGGRETSTGRDAVDITDGALNGRRRSKSERARALTLETIATIQRLQARVPRLIAFLRVVYYPIALALVAYIAYDAVKKIDLAKLHYWPLLGSYVFALAWWLCLAFGWSTLTTEKYRAREVSAWCRTQVARYFPGGIWAPVARATTVKGRVRDKVAAVAAENVIVLCIALATGALWVSVHNPVWLPLVLIGFLPLFGIKWLARRSQVTRKGVMKTMLTYAVGYFFYGLSGILAQVAFSGLHRPTYPLYVAGATCVAWAIGLVVVFAPGGVGVRELVYIWMLSGLTYTSADLKGAAVASRLVSVFAELTVLAVVTRPRFRHAPEHIPDAKTTALTPSADPLAADRAPLS